MSSMHEECFLQQINEKDKYASNKINLGWNKSHTNENYNKNKNEINLMLWALILKFWAEVVVFLVPCHLWHVN